MKHKYTVWLFLTFVASMNAHGQSEIEVSPGDDLQAALRAAGPGGTVFFAPGRYDVVPTDPWQREALYIPADLAGITLRGAGPGVDPKSATILDGEAGFLQTGFFLEASDITVEGFSLINFWGQGFLLGDRTRNVECNRCWVLGCNSGVDTHGTAGFWDEKTPDNLDKMARFKFCIFARGGRDGADAKNGSALAFVHCDFYDWRSDQLAPKDTSVILARNCIFHAGLNSDDIQANEASLIYAKNCVFFDPRGGETDGLGGMEFIGFAYATDSIGQDPGYAHVGPDVPFLELDFHLRPGSPALTAGRDGNGNPTFAGAIGPTQ